MIAPDFKAWLDSRCIDCQLLQPELLAALQSQYESDCQRLSAVKDYFITPNNAKPEATKPTGKRSRIDAHVKDKVFG